MQPLLFFPTLYIRYTYISVYIYRVQSSSQPSYKYIDKFATSVFRNKKIYFKNVQVGSRYTGIAGRTHSTVAFVLVQSEVQPMKAEKMTERDWLFKPGV